MMRRAYDEAKGTTQSTPRLNYSPQKQSSQRAGKHLASPLNAQKEKK